MTSNELSEKERMMTYDQIMMSAQITIGVTLMAIGVSITLTRIGILLTEDMFSSLDFGLSIASAAYILPGLILLWKGLEKCKKKYGVQTKKLPKRSNKSLTEAPRKKSL